MLTPSSGIPALTELDDDAVLREHAERFRLIAQATNDVVWDWNLVTNDLQFSPAVRSVFRYGPEAVVDDIDWWANQIHPDDREIVLKELNEAIAGSGKFWSAEYRFLRGDGSDAHVFDRGFISRDDSGKAVRMAGSMFDLTDRKLAEQALRDSERRFRSLIENASDAIAVIDREGKFVFASQSYETVLGYTPAELRGLPVLDLVHEEDIPEAARNLAGIMQQAGATVHLTLRCRHKNGSWRTLEATGRNRLDDPAIEGIVAASRDVTQERALENELVQAQKMEAVGQLAGGVAHDFNNLLTVISTNTEMLASRLQADPGALENLLEIRRAAGQAGTLTRQLLTFTQRRSGDPQVTNLNDVVTDSAPLLERMAGESTTLRYALATSPPLVRLDRSQLEQVLMNLVVNARDALPDGGFVAISTERVRVTDDDDASAGAPPGEYAVLTARDNGEGMTPETRARAFEPFYTTKAIGRGTGLGLSMVYSIVKHAGGYIDLSSGRGSGSTFRIFLPRVTAETPAPRGDGPPARDRSGGETVLLVEDEAMVRRVVRRTLASHGYEVIEAANGSEALAIAMEDPSRISLVVTDVMMPVMGGPELARRLWDRFPDLKIVFLSGYAPDNMSAESAVPPGAVLIEKPFAIDTLLATLRDVLDGATTGVARD